MRLATIRILLCLAGWVSSDGVRANDFTESEALLAGFKRLETTDAYPPRLEIPAAWRKAFLEMTARTRKDNREVGACLLRTTAANAEQERKSTMAEYSTLLAKQSDMSPKDFVEQEALLRQRVEQSEDDAGRATELTVGNIQGGEQTWRVSIEENSGHCSGEILGHVHTHPEQSLPSLSESDLSYTLYNDLAIMAVLHGQEMCLMLRDNTHPAEEDGTPWKFGANVFSSAAFTDDRQILRQAAARLIALHGAAYYCGVIGKPLEKINLGPELPNGKRQILATKALVVMSANNDTSQKISLDFQFTPQLDAQFLKVVGGLLPNYSAKEIRALSAKSLFEKLAPVLMPEEGISFFTGMNLPDDRDMPKGSLYRTFNCDFGKKLKCQMIRLITPEDGVIEASYEESNRQSRIARLHPGAVERYTLLETDERRGIWIKGEGKIQDRELYIDGPGFLKTPNYEWKGTLDVWTPTGLGQAREKGEQQWRAARAEGGIVHIAAGQ